MLSAQTPQSAIANENVGSRLGNDGWAGEFTKWDMILGIWMRSFLAVPCVIYTVTNGGFIPRNSPADIPYIHGAGELDFNLFLRTPYMLFSALLLRIPEPATKQTVNFLGASRRKNSDAQMLA